MIEPNLPGLSVSKQCKLLSISRSSFYYEPKGESEMNLDLMRLMGLIPIYQKPNTSKAAKGHKIYSYLLPGLRVISAQPDLVRRYHLSADAARVPLSRGDHGLARSQSAGLAHIEHDGGRLLCRGTERGDPQARSARDHEHRSGLPVHVLRLDRPAAPIRCAHLYGRQGLVPR